MPRHLVPFAIAIAIAPLGPATRDAQAAAPGGDADLLHFRQVTTGESHSCGLWSDGIVGCWGENYRHQLGTERVKAFAEPLALPKPTEVKMISAGDNHTCAVTRRGGVWCWGDDQGHQSGGHGDTMSSPHEIADLPHVGSVAAGSSHTCALAMDGRVFCWGNNLYGQLGTDDGPSRAQPLEVPGIEGATSLAAGYGHTCAAVATGGVICWGDNQHGQLGRAQASGADPLPLETELPSIRGLTAREHETCAVHAEGLTCWGGDGEHPAATTVRMRRSDLVMASLGWGHVCAVTGGGTVLCGGSNDQGQLGSRIKTAEVTGAYGIHDATSVTAGRAETCASRRDQPTVCWGRIDPSRQAAGHPERAPEALPKTVERQLPQGIDLSVRMGEVLGFAGSQVRVTIATVDTQPCANTTLQTEVKIDKKKIILTLGDPQLPDGICVASPAPAVVTYDVAADVKGRRDLVIRYKGKEDFYQLFVSDNRVESMPLQDSFSAWDGPATYWRVPDSSLAITCQDRTDAPICRARAEDRLPQCRHFLAQAAIAGAPTLKRRAFGSAWFRSDPNATLISPDDDVERYRELVESSFADGSRCMQLTVRTWRGETWSNQP